MVRFVAVVCLLILACGPQDGQLRKSPRPSPAPRVGGTIITVTDADSYVVLLQGRKERVRLIGVDAPEASPNRRAQRQAAQSGRGVPAVVEDGRKAAGAVSAMLGPGDSVYVELDVQERDRYGRLLVYLYFPDGRMLNEVLLEEGLARLLTVPPNVRHVDRLRSAARGGNDNQTHQTDIPKTGTVP